MLERLAQDSRGKLTAGTTNPLDSLMKQFADDPEVTVFLQPLPMGAANGNGGTCSRARDKAVPLALRKQGAPSPPPLRDHDHLLGLPHLSPLNQMRVNSANKLYNQAVELLFVCYSLGLWVSIENPRRSWLWQVLAVLVKQQGDSGFRQWYFCLVDVHYDACMHGGSRAKATRLLSSPGLFESLAVELMSTANGA